MTMTKLQEILNQIKYPGYSFQLEEVFSEHQEFFMLRVVYDEPDVLTGIVEQQEGRWWIFPQKQTVGQVVQTAFKAILTSNEHRVREHFTYKDKPVMMPHMDLDWIADNLRSN